MPHAWLTPPYCKHVAINFTMERWREFVDPAGGEVDPQRKGKSPSLSRPRHVCSRMPELPICVRVRP
jgi:hypothetical protein